MHRIFEFFEKRKRQKIRMKILEILFSNNALHCPDILNLEALTLFVLYGKVDEKELREKFPSWDAYLKEQEKDLNSIRITY